jgi:hypothetical protein
MAFTADTRSPRRSRFDWSSVDWSEWIVVASLAGLLALAFVPPSSLRDHSWTALGDSAVCERQAFLAPGYFFLGFH